MQNNTTGRQTEEPLVLDVSLAGSKADKTVIDADVLEPLFWGEDAHQLANLAAIREAGL